MANVPLLVPLAGETVHQDVAFDTAVHETLDVTETLTDEAPAPPVPEAALRLKLEAIPDVQNDLVSDAPNWPPDIKVVVPCLIR